MKNLLLILISTILIVGCNNVDNEINELSQEIIELNERLNKIDSINAQIATLNSTVAAITTSLNSLTANNSNLASQVAALQNQLLSVIAELDDMATALSTNQTNLDALQAALTALQASVADILDNSTIYNKDVVITNREELELAKTKSSSFGIINADVLINVGPNSNIKASDISEVTSKMKIIVGSLVVTTDAEVDFSQLTNVGGNYVVVGHDVKDNSLVSVGNAYLDYDGGYSLSSLVNSGVVSVVDYDKSLSTSKSGKIGTLFFDFGSLKSNTSMMTSSNINFNFTDGAISVGQSGGVPGVIKLDNAATVVLGEAASPSSIDVPVASTVVLKTTGVYAGSLVINAPLATKIEIAVTSINGTLTVVGGTSTVFEAPELTSILGNASITASDIKLESLTTVTGTITVTGDADLDLSEQLTSGTFENTHNSGGSNGGSSGQSGN